MKTASKDDLEDLNISHAVLQSETGSVLCQDSFDKLSEGLGVVGLVEQKNLHVRGERKRDRIELLEVVVLFVENGVIHSMDGNGYVIKILNHAVLLLNGFPYRFAGIGVWNHVESLFLNHISMRFPICP